jgi:hypothetical protein
MYLKKTYKDFEIGQTLLCVKNTTHYYCDDERLVVGNYYQVTDVDYHFQDRICIKLTGPFYFQEEFAPIECFSDIQALRELRIDEILKK